MNVDGRSESATHKRMCFTSLRNPLYMTHSLTQTLLLFFSLGSGENITLSEMFILLMGHEHSHIRRCMLFQSHWWVAVKVVSKSSLPSCGLSASPELSLAEAHRRSPVWGFTDLHYLSVQHHSSHPRNLMEHSKFRLLWRVLRLRLNIHSALLYSTCKKGKCELITIIQLLKIALV